MSFEAQVLTLLTNMSGEIGELKNKVVTIHDTCSDNKNNVKTLTTAVSEVKARLELVPDETFIRNHKWVSDKIQEEDAKAAAIKGWKTLVLKEGISKAMVIMVSATFATIGGFFLVFWEKAREIIMSWFS